jgi:hypothetical protein
LGMEVTEKGKELAGTGRQLILIILSLPNILIGYYDSTWGFLANILKDPLYIATILGLNLRAVAPLLVNTNVVPQSSLNLDRRLGFQTRFEYLLNVLVIPNNLEVEISQHHRDGLST